MHRTEQFLIAIIGAGPAGLCCAYELTKNKVGPVLMIEKGCNVNKRNHRFFLSHYTEGIGGPGLYGDAKLCVYGQAGTKLTNFFSENILHQLADYVDKIFWKFDKKYTRKESPSKFRIEKLQKICKISGFELKMVYPIRHLGFKRGKAVIENFINWLKQNRVLIKTETQAVKIIKNKKRYTIILKRKNSKKEIIQCKYLIIGVGRSGNQWLKKQCDILKIPYSLNVPDIGIRIECPKNILKPVYGLAKNPRIELSVSSEYIKTHCLCVGGEIITYSVNNIPCVDGHTNHEGENVHINLLYHSDRNKEFIDNLSELKKPIVQRLEDFMLNRPSLKKRIIKNKLIPTAPLSSFSFDNDINDIFSAKMVLLMKKFINHFNGLCPGFNSDDNLVYAPAIEWNTYQIKVNKEMETQKKDLYIIGDGSGFTQGIIAAGVMGVIAAQSIISKEKRTPKDRCLLE